MKVMRRKEIWKDIPGYEGLYEVSNKGRIKSLYKESYSGPNYSVLRAYPEKILRQHSNNKGYKMITLNNKKSYLTSRLVAEVFIPNPDNLPEVNHKKPNKKNNAVWNLEWTTRSGNMRHAYDNGLQKTGQSHHFSKLKNKEVNKIKILLNEFHPPKIIAEVFNISLSAIYAIKNKVHWNYLR